MTDNHCVYCGEPITSADSDESVAETIAGPAHATCVEARDRSHTERCVPSFS